QPRQHVPTQSPDMQPYAYAQAPAAPAQKASMEKIIGKNILPFIAAGLVFIGLIFLAILVVPKTTDFQRFIGMFALSGTIFAVGFVLARRKKNVFSVALLGTGIGALFISILMTRIYFEYLSDVPTFALLLVWMVVCMALVKMFNSLTLSITAHVGMAISVIFAFAQGFDQERALIVVAYQVIATIVIVGGSLLAYRKTYRFGLVASLVLTLVATIVIRSQDIAEISTGVYVTSLLIQFVTASTLSFFLATSSAKLSKDTRLVFHYGNKILWIVLTLLTLWSALFHAADAILYNGKHMGDSQALTIQTIATLGCAAVFVIHAFISAILERSIGMPEDMVRISIIGTLSAATLMTLYRVSLALTYGGTILIPFAFVLALIALGIGRLLSDRTYTVLAIALLGIDAITAVTGISTFVSRTPVALIFVWIVAIMVTSVAIWASWKPAEKRREFLPILILLNLIFFELTLPQALFTAISSEELAAVLSLAIVMLVLFVLRFVNIEALMGMTKTGHVIFAINEYLAVLLAIMFVGANIAGAMNLPQALWWVSVVLVIAISILRIFQSRNVSSLHPTPIQYLSAIALTLVTQAPLWGSMYFGKATAFASSLVLMLVALVLIGMGFALRLKPVRLYGLGLTIFTVFKLATYDVSNISATGRVIGFIGAGVIAFLISALYNYANKRLNSSGIPKAAGAVSAPNAMPYPAMQQMGVPQHVGAPQQAGIPQQVAAPQPMTGQAMPAPATPAQPSVPSQPVTSAQPMPAQPSAPQAPMPRPEGAPQQP
ncbi:MAG: DUF2339 domain-containing protein, partial [Actinomycetaceae bacterium]|nr:DUF2339 domain-containing protein [Actinomycetaceae bacterium]